MLRFGKREDSPTSEGSSAAPSAATALINPVFQLLLFGGIICYIQVLVESGHSLSSAVVAVLVAWAGTLTCKMQDVVGTRPGTA